MSDVFQEMDRQKQQQENAARRRAQKPSKQESFLTKATNAPLGMLEWFTDVIYVAPSMHRFQTALSGTIGMFIAMQIANTLTGKHVYKAKDFTKNDIWIPGLHLLHNKMPYNLHNDATGHQVMRFLHATFIAVGGMIGVTLGSKNFFRKESEAADKAEFIDEYEMKSNVVQGNAWQILSTPSSAMSSVSGVDILPFSNYTLTLSNRFLAMSGRKVALPVVGKYISNNHTLYPLGPTKLRDYMLKYALHNPDPAPKQLEEMAKGILKSWFADVTPEQINQFVDEVHKVRDHYYQMGGVPEEDKKALETDFKKHFKGAGLEETLEKIGLNPADAVLGANGFTTAVAKGLGAAGKLKRIEDEYEKKYLKRRAERENTHSHEPATQKPQETSHAHKDIDRPGNIVSFAEVAEKFNLGNDRKGAMPGVA